MSHFCKITNIENSPLFEKIADAIEKHGVNVYGIRVSITKEAEDYTPENEDKTYFLKWLSWSLIDNKNKELFDPYLVPVHSDLTEKQIQNDLSNHFPKYQVIVDNEIFFEL